MCIEVFSPVSPIDVQYASELVHFTGHRSFRSVCIFLIRNVGKHPIEFLNLLYPRSLYERDKDGFHLAGLQDITARVGQYVRDMSTDPQMLTARLLQDDPNRPQFERSPLIGDWQPTPANIGLPADFPTEGVSLLSHYASAFAQVDLSGQNLIAGASRWFAWEVTVGDPNAPFDSPEGVGLPLETPTGKAVIHQVASPHDVYRTISEKLEAGQLESEVQGPEWLAKLHKVVREKIGLESERRVEIGYYELTLLPGKPEERFIVSWEAERDLRMRSRSPRIGEDPRWERLGEMIYEWKSGNILKPHNSSWKNQGFLLHVTMACR